MNNPKDTLHEWLSRLDLQLRFAEEFLNLHPNAACQKEVESVKAALAEKRPTLSASTVESFVLECENKLKKTSKLIKETTVHFVAHAHIDMNWKWSFDETVAVAQDTFATMLTLMDKYPDFKFSQSQASLYRMIEQYSPQMLNQIKRRVKEGRWEVSSATWVEADKNMSSGESQIRQVLYAKRYYNKLFGLTYDDLTLDYEPDTFGHSANIPATLSSLGVKYYYHCRGFLGPKLYRWLATSGESIICYLETNEFYLYAVAPDSVTDTILNELKETGLKDVLRVYGVGDHGGGPTVRDIENIRKIATWPVFPTVKFSTYAEYFKAVESSGAELPIVSGEHNFICTGCYTSQSEIKKANRHGEKHLMEAEAFSAIAAQTTGLPYPTGNLTNAWEMHLFNQFHDILPGSGVRDTREYTLGKFQKIMAATSSAKKQALKSIADSIDTAALLQTAGIEEGPISDRALGAGAGFWQNCYGISAPSVGDANYRIFTIFNPSPFTRSEIVEVVLWDIISEVGLSAKDSNGNECIVQMVEEDQSYAMHTHKTILLEAKNIPALGYKSFIVYEDPSKPKDKVFQLDVNMRLDYLFDNTIENDHLKAVIDTQTGALTSLKLKDQNLEFVPEGKKSAIFRIIDESPTNTFDGLMSAWLVGTYSNETPADHARFFPSVEIQTWSYSQPTAFTATRGPLRNGVVWTVDARNSKLTIGMYLDKGSKALKMYCKCDWLEQGTMRQNIPQLNILFNLPIEKARRLYEVPFGIAERDALDMDVPAIRWADISGKIKGSNAQAGLTLTTDSKYGYRAGDDFISISLIRSSYDPDLHPEFGEHLFNIAAIPHANECNPEAASQEAISFDQPLTVFQTTAHKGSLPLEQSFVEIRNANILLSALKKSEEGKEMVMRVYEVSGQDTEAEFAFQKEVILTEADALERKTGNPVHSRNGIIKHKIPAHATVTLIIADQSI